MEWLYLGIVLGAGYVLALAGYKLWLSTRSLLGQIKQTEAALGSFGPEDFELEPAKPSAPEDLARLLRARKAMQKRKAQEREERQRRLVARISSINIDRR
jgi:50S ribosomal subunit-associated GTPase HflX